MNFVLGMLHWRLHRFVNQYKILTLLNSFIKKTLKMTIKPFYFTSLLFILVSCLGLFLLDRENHSIADLFEKSNLIALPLYVIPTYLVCAFIFYFLDSKNKKHSAVLALTMGIPLGITCMIIILSFLMGRL
jgi:hypothetical protein